MIRTLLRSLLCAPLLAATLDAQVWDTASDHARDPSFVQLDYPVVFVSTQGHADVEDETPPHFGLDVIAAGNPAPQGPGGGLYVLMPNQEVKKLFPLPEHEVVPGLIDTPMGELFRGAVVEPNLSEDGRRVYFAWFHDQTWKKGDGGWQQQFLSYKGSDLYSLDLGPLIDDPATDPAALPIQRLTFKEYTGPAKTNVQQTLEDRMRYAINPSTEWGFGYWGGIEMHMIEMRTIHGLKAVWVSNRARAGNSNSWFSDPNHNFNLYIADIREDGSLGPAEQFQYFTTTSALSPAPLRNGLAFSYQSSTTEPRNWDIQVIDSAGRWKPLIGYGHGSRLFHLGSYVVDEAGRDWFLGLKYYNFNDGGFGAIHKTPMAGAGFNFFYPTPQGDLPRQYSTKLTVGVVTRDEPSTQVEVDGRMLYVGKFSCPRPGRVGGEYLMSYTPTSANRWKVDADGVKNRYEAVIAYRPNLEPFEPWEPVDRANGKGLYAVVADASNQYDLLWPTPVLTWEERTGSPKQEVAPAIRDADSPIAPGMPFAQVGTSAIYNTDIRPFDCLVEGTHNAPFSPNTITQPGKEGITDAVEGLRYVMDPDDLCRYLTPEYVLGISVNLTSNRVDLLSTKVVQYTTDGRGIGNRREAAELLGVFAPEEENMGDHSFLAKIPSDVPFDFHLLDKKYGMKLVDVRSWHSLKPRETRTDCGGCHQHEVGFAIPFENTEAAQKPAFDMTRGTSYVAYDADCKPEIRRDPAPTRKTPEWRTDVWPQFDQHCSRCHDANVSTDSGALLAFDYADEKSARQQMLDRNYANSTWGALGSPAFWAAYGERTDGRDNDLLAYRPDYANGVFGYRFSSVHATDPALCSSSNPAWAEWVRTFGNWIDNHTPRNVEGTTFGYNFDRYHPTVDLALVNVGGPNGLKPERPALRIGFWDNTGQVDLEVQLNGVSVWTATGQPNGSVRNEIPFRRLQDVITVIATDPNGNRQIKSKTMLDLLQETGGPRGGR